MDQLSDNFYDCIDESAKNEELLKAMGFNNEIEIREALKIAKNDINEAVSILTSERLPKLIPQHSNDNEIIMSSDSSSDSPSSNKNNNDVK